MTNNKTKFTAIGLTLLMVLSVFSMPVAAQPAAQLDADASTTTVSAGDTVEVTYTLTNTGDESGTGGLQVSTPDGVSVENVEGDGTNSPDRFFIEPVAADDTVEVTYTYSVASDATGTLSIDAEATLGDSSDTVTTDITVDDGDDGDNGDDGAESDYDTTYDKDALSGQVIFQGQVIGVEGFDAGERVQLRTGSTDDSSFEEYLNANDDGVVEVDTSDYDGSLVIRDSDGNDYGTLEVSVQNVDFAFADDSIEYEGTTNLVFEDDNRGEAVDIIVSADGLDADQLAGVLEGASVHDEDAGEVLIEGVEEEDEIAADFAGITADTYEFSVSVEDTTADSTAIVTVEESVAVDATFADRTASQQVGDVAEVTLNLQGTDSATVDIADNTGDYTATLTVMDDSDDGEVTVQMDTFLAGHDNPAAFSAADEDDSVEVESAVNIDGDYQLADGSYDLTVTVDNEETDVATLSLTERDTIGASTLIAPRNADFAEVDDIADSVEAGEVAFGDNLAIHVEANGIFAYLDEDVSAEGMSLTFTQENFEGKYGNAPSFTVSDSDAFELVEDAANDRFFVTVDTEQLRDEQNIEAGDEYSVTFEISDANPYVADDESESVSTSVTFQDRTSSFDLIEEPYQVSVDEPEVRGTSTLAPGSEITVQALKSGDFLETTEGVEIQDDGTFSASLSFDQGVPEVDTAFELSIKQGGDTEAVDAVFADTPEWETQESSEQLQQRIAELEAENENLTQLNEELSTEVANLEAQLENASSDEELEEAQATIEDLESQLEEAPSQQELSDLQLQLNEAQNSVSELETVRDDLQNQVENLESQLEEAPSQDELDQKDSTISDLEDEVADLESQLEEAQATTTGGPGFTAVLALIALIGAALLAVRRQQ